jgi:hypothetical protein
MNDFEEFSWSRDKDCICVAEQLQIAVFENGRGDLVIRQQDPMGDDDDWVIVAKNNVPSLCRALFAAAGIEMESPAVTYLPAISSGAERSRRYRKRHAQHPERDANVTARDGGVTHGDAELPLGEAAE